MKFNPGLLDDDALITSFAARERELADILEVVRDNTGASNQHLLLIGPRGSGKTTLVLRAAAAIHRDPELSRRVYPLIFGEETYEVHSAGSLWLEALHYLGRQTGARRWRAAYEDLRAETDPTRLRTLALGELRDFSEGTGQRLLVVIENLGTLLDHQLDESEAWALRHTLQTEPWLMLLATATSRFGGIDRSDQALFDLFRVSMLDPLRAPECLALWQRLTGRTLDALKGRALEILTGGNPRLLAILSSIAGDPPLDTLVADLTRLIDEQTPYFKSNIDSLAPQEQRVFAALADLWETATTREVAERTRLPVNTVSAVLGRLERSGVVVATETAPRRKRYQLAERLYNIYYALRRRGSNEERVRFAIDFIAALSDANTLIDHLLLLADAAPTTPPQQRLIKVQAFLGVYDKLRSVHAARILPNLPQSFLALPELPPERRQEFDAELVRVRKQRQSFMALCAEWWDSHRVPRETLAAALTLPALAQAWTEFLAILRGEASVQKVSANSRVARALIELAPQVQKICRRAVSEQPSWVDILVTCALASFWLEDETLLEQALRAAHARWPASPWVRLAYASFSAPDRFVADAEFLLAAAPQDPWLPLAIGAVLDLEDRPQLASRFYRRSPLCERLPALAVAFAEILAELREHEWTLLTDPLHAGLAHFLAPEPWCALFAWLARSAARVGRWTDTAAILELAHDHGLNNPSLRLMLGASYLRSGRVEAGLALVDGLVTTKGDDWRVGVALAAVLVELRRPEDALVTFSASYVAFSASTPSEVSLRERASAWLAPITAHIPDSHLPAHFLAVLRASPDKLRSQLTKVLRGPVETGEHVRRVVATSLALAVRDERASLLVQLRNAPAAPRLEGLIAGIARSLGETPSVPRELAEAADDLATQIQLFTRLDALLRGVPPR